jgi:FkbM family methyltransferase
MLGEIKLVPLAVSRATDLVARLSRSSAPLSDDDVRALRELLVEVVSQNRFGLCADAARLGSRLLEERPALQDDLVLARTLTFVGWVAEHPIGPKMGKRWVALEPQNAQAYQFLGLSQLLAGNAVDAFLTFGAGLATAAGPSLNSWRRLAEAMMRGIQRVEVTVDGERYLFELSCFSGQAMEAASTHLLGRLTELDELRMVRDTIGRARVIVEVGTLVGNHTVFFARNLRPEKVYCFDLDPRSVRQTSTNFRLNFPGETPVLVMVPKGVGDARKTTERGSRTVEMTTLSSEVAEPVDFIKVEVDGMELQVLEGARDLFLAHRPRALIEVAHDNAPGFLRFVESIGYQVKAEFKRAADTNYLIAPAVS